MIKFTIVTITYNAAPVFVRTAESVLCQDYPCLEHIIVDGASTDGTIALAEDYKKRSDAAGNGHCIRIVSEPDKGLYDAMNKGLTLATGDYVCYMNAGDFFPDGRTLSAIVANTHVDEMERAGRALPAVLYGDTDWVDNDGNYLCRRPLTPPEYLTWRSFKHGMLVCHQSFYARTDIARDISYDLGYRHSADIDWCIRVMKDAERRSLPLLNTHATLACYQREGQTTKYHRASLLERFDIMCRHYGRITTVCMHLWFIIRAVKRKIKKRS